MKRHPALAHDLPTFQSPFGVTPRMFAIWLLLCLVSYIFAVMFTQLFKDLYEQGATGDVDYFGCMDKTFFTLFQIMTLDAWSDISRDGMAVYPWAWLPIIAYVILTGFVVVNIFAMLWRPCTTTTRPNYKAKPCLRTMHRKAVITMAAHTLDHVVVLRCRCLHRPFGINSRHRRITWMNCRSNKRILYKLFLQSPSNWCR
jgi:Ion transport protein